MVVVVFVLLLLLPFLHFLLSFPLAIRQYNPDTNTSTMVFLWVSLPVTQVQRFEGGHILAVSAIDLLEATSTPLVALCLKCVARRSAEIKNYMNIYGMLSLLHMRG